MNNILKVYLKNCITLPLFIFVLTFIIFINSKPASDPDIWWHLNIGRDILQKGFQYKDIYSYTLAGYKWIDHEWLLNVFMYVFYSLSNNNFLLLSIIFSGLTFFSFYNVLKFVLPNKAVFYFCFLLGLFACSCCLGIRAQVISLFFTSILWSIINKQKLKIYKYLPLLFLIWANFHGAVIIGLALFGLDWILSFKKKKIFKYKLFILILSFLATLINPYHFHIYLESFRVFLDTTAHYYVQEWKRPNLLNKQSITFLIYIVSIYGFLLKFKTKPIYLITIIFFSILSLRSIRHFTIFVLLSLPFYAASIKSLSQKINLKHIQNLIIFFSLFSIFSISFFTFDNLFNIFNRLTDQSNYYSTYPQKALDFIEKENLKGNILAEYEWGGFISWYKPNIKIFIDGRMPSWTGVLQDFILVRLKGNESILQKYKIDYLLLYSDKSLYSNKPKQHKFKNAKIMYQDKVSTLFKVY